MYRHRNLERPWHPKTLEKALHPKTLEKALGESRKAATAGQALKKVGQGIARSPGLMLACWQRPWPHIVLVKDLGRMGN